MLFCFSYSISTLSKVIIIYLCNINSDYDYSRRGNYNQRDVEMGKRLKGGEENDDNDTEISFGVTPGQKNVRSI